MNKILKLKDVLLTAEEFEFGVALFLIKDEQWTLKSNCAVLDPDDVEDDSDEEPRFAIENNLKYTLGMHDVQDIVDNAKQQNLYCTEDDLLKAFLFYYDNDAFIVFDGI